MVNHALFEVGCSSLRVLDSALALGINSWLPGLGVESRVPCDGVLAHSEVLPFESHVTPTCPQNN